jgi:hypothetical protein
MAKVTIDIKANDDASKKLEQVSKSMKALEKETQETSKTTGAATKIMQGFSGAMIGVNQGLELASKVGAAAKAAFDFSREGAVLSQTSESFERMTEALGPNVDLLQQLRDASRNTVDDLTIMSAVLTLTAGVSEDLGKSLLDSSPALMEIAKAASAVNPTLGDTAWMFESINTGIKRNSPLILDNLGIIVKVGEANEKYAEALGKTTEELTAEETQMALLNAVLETGDRLIEQAGGSAESAVDPFDEFTASTKNLGNTFKEKMLPYAIRFVDVMDLLINWTDKVGEAKDQMNDRLLDTTHSYEDYVMEMLEAKEAAYGLNNAEKHLMGQLKSGALSISDLTDEHSAYGEHLVWVTKKMQGYTQEEYYAQKALQYREQQMGDAVRTFSEYDGAVQHIITSNGEYTYSVIEATGATNEIAESTAKWAEAIIYAVPNMSAMENAIYTSSYNAGILRDNINEMVNDLYAGGSAATDFATKFNNATYNIAIGREELETIGETAEALFAAGAIDQGTFLDATALLGAAAAMREYEGGFSTYWETVQNLRDLDLDPTEISDMFKGVTDPMAELQDLIPDFDLLDFDPVATSALALADNLNNGLLEAKGLHEVLTEINGMEVSATVNVSTTGGFDLAAMELQYGVDLNQNGIIGAANGFDGIVPSGHPNDSFLQTFALSSGERVTVTPGGGGGGNPIIININSTFAPENEEQFKRMVRPAMVQLIREQGAL